MNQDRSLAVWIGRLSITGAAIGVTTGYREFTKWHWGPFYVLEIAFFLWAVCAIFTNFNKPFLAYCRNSYPIILFALWGAVLLVADITTSKLSLTPVSWNRVAQHAIIVFYPAMWTLAGFWLLTTGRSLTDPFTWIFIVCASLHNFIGLNVINIAVGPIIVLPFLLFLHRWRWNRVLLTATLAVLTFWPFWRMWTMEMQRTSLVILLMNMLGVPWILKSPEESYWKCIRTIILSFGIFMLGILIYSRHSKQSNLALRAETVPMLPSKPKQETPHVVKSTSTPIKPAAIIPPSEPIHPPTEIAHPPPDRSVIPAQKIIKKETYRNTFHSLYHSDDYLTSSRIRLPLMLTRRIMWNSTLGQWREHRILGIGFIAEVPREVFPGLRNVGGFETGNAPPVSGPHNSYLSILARTGLIGLLLFVWMVIHSIQQAKTVYHRTQPVNLFVLLLFMVPVNGAIHAFLNVGLESPPRAMLMWLFLGMLVALYVQDSPGEY